MTLEEQLNREVHFITNIDLDEQSKAIGIYYKNCLFNCGPPLQVQKQSMLSHNAQDSQTLWEEELKGRSRLGLRLSELEREKGELTNQVHPNNNNVHPKCVTWIFFIKISLHVYIIIMFSDSIKKVSSVSTWKWMIYM